MAIDLVTLSSFSDELVKIAVSHGFFHRTTKSRKGRRPMTVDTMLRKEKDGTLYKQAVQDVRGDSCDDPGAAQLRKRQAEVPTKEPNIPSEAKLGYVYGDTSPFQRGESPGADFQEAKKPRRKGELPSRDNSNVVDRYDQRDNATTVHGLGQSSTGIGAFNSPAEHP